MKSIKCNIMTLKIKKTHKNLKITKNVKIAICKRNKNVKKSQKTVK